jgi:hypothetical protein
MDRHSSGFWKTWVCSEAPKMKELVKQHQPAMDQQLVVEVDLQP